MYETQEVTKAVKQITEIIDGLKLQPGISTAKDLHALSEHLRITMSKTVSTQLAEMMVVLLNEYGTQKTLSSQLGMSQKTISRTISVHANE